MFGTGRNIETDALVVKRTPFADADWVVELFTAKLGKVTAIAARARQSRHRFAGGLEAFHNICVQLRPTRNGELLQLSDAFITHARYALVSQLLAMQIAGRALDWLRRTIPPRIVDPQAWCLVQDWMNAIDANPPGNPPLANARLAEYGLQLLTILGWSLEFSRCIRCSKPCPSQSSAYLSPNLGGVVCRACGGTGDLISASLRKDLVQASLIGSAELAPEHGADALSVVERTLMSHAGIGSGAVSI
jgi:DNA repair protein RecO (recombination protein O)